MFYEPSEVCDLRGRQWQPANRGTPGHSELSYFPEGACNAVQGVLYSTCGKLDLGLRCPRFGGTSNLSHWNNCSSWRPELFHSLCGGRTDALG